MTGTMKFSYACDRLTRPNIFISYRYDDTYNNVAEPIFEKLCTIEGVVPFLDAKCMLPGDRYPEKIGGAIESCKVAVVVFSPGFTSSRNCLNEFAKLVEIRKQILPVFVNVHPPELSVMCTEVSKHELEWYGAAIHEAKNIKGFDFDSSTGDMSEALLRDVSAAVARMLSEVVRSVPDLYPNSLVIGGRLYDGTVSSTQFLVHHRCPSETVWITASNSRFVRDDGWGSDEEAEDGFFCS